MKERVKKFIIDYRIEIILYFVLIPVFCPDGFVWYSSLYKLFFTFWIYAAAGVCAFLLLYAFKKRELKYKNCVNYLLIYQAVFILVTLFLQRRIHDGKQKLFLVPFICLFCAMCLEKEKDRFIDAVSNVIIGELLLNITVFHPFFWTPFFNADEHVLFIGHVQVVVQIGILGLFLSYVLYRRNKQDPKTGLLVFLVIITMIMSDTMASYLVLFVWSACFVMVRWKKGTKFLLLPTEIYVGLMLLANVLIVLIIILCRGNYTPFFGIDISFHGRMYIWQAALEQLKDHWIFGYGCYGFMLQVFWSEWTGDGLGMNYAHSEIFQRLLEGGIVILILFILLICAYGHGIRKLKDSRTKMMANICMGSFFLIMLIESVTEYYYFFVFMSFIGYIPELESTFQEEKGDEKYMGVFSEIRRRFCMKYYGVKISKTAASCGEALYVGGKSYVTPYTTLGSHVSFNGMAIMGQGNVSIGDYFHSGTGCEIITSFHNYEGECIPYDTSYIDKDVQIGKCVWLGNNVIILGGVTIGEGAIIQAGSVVCKDIPPYGIAGGHPAVVFKYRDKEHYDMLKEQKRFY